MAVPRPLLLALIGVVLMAATFYTSRSAREEAAPAASAAPIEKVEVAEPAPKPKPAKAAKPAPEAKAPEPEPAPAPAKARKQEASAQKPAAERKAAAKSKASRKPRFADPAALDRFLSQGKVLVLFFYQPGSADDDATAKAVAAVRGKGVAVYGEPIKNVKRYGAIVAATGVSQAPSVVVVGKRGGQLLEGFIDVDTLRQEVADARG